MKVLSPWISFILERFPPLRHLLLVSCLFGANAFVALEATHLSKSVSLVSFLIVFIAFFRLRLFDEIKDYNIDCLINSHRPLARGLISIQAAKKVAFSLMLLELALSATIGLPALIAASCYTGYSLLMYKEFFISTWLRSKLATYALTHTIVSSLIALFIFSAVTGRNIWEAPFPFILFALANWMIFNVFEFGRKTFGKEEEQSDIDSYSKNFGSWGAAGSVFSMAVIAEIIALALGVHFGWPLVISLSLTLLFLPLFFSCFFYGWLNSKPFALLFRTTCFSFILFYNLILCLGFLC